MLTSTFVAAAALAAASLDAAAELEAAALLAAALETALEAAALSEDALDAALDDVPPEHAAKPKAKTAAQAANTSFFICSPFPRNLFEI